MRKHVIISRNGKEMCINEGRCIYHTVVTLWAVWWVVHWAQNLAALMAVMMAARIYQKLCRWSICEKVK